MNVGFTMGCKKRISCAAVGALCAALGAHDAAAAPPVLGTFRIDAPGLPGSLDQAQARETAEAEPRWVEHRVIPGERLNELAQRYRVSRDDIIKWNRLNPKKPWLRAGRSVRVHSVVDAPQRKRTLYKVRFGDSWDGIAERHGISRKHLRRWNKSVPFRFRAGQKLVMWVETEAAPQPVPAPIQRKLQPAAAATATALAAATATAAPIRSVRSAVAVMRSAGEPTLRAEPAPMPAPAPAPEPVMVQVAASVSGGATPPPDETSHSTPLVPRSEALLVPVPGGGQSLGRPDRGRLRRAVQIPQNDALYTRRRPKRAYGSTHAVRTLQAAVAAWRHTTPYGGSLIISDMSSRRGGLLAPHQSHQSGRDVDIWLPLKEELPQGTQPRRASEVDWPATWALIKALIDTGEVQYIFLNRSRQRKLYRAARDAGMSGEELAEIIQYPLRSRTRIVRHEKGHSKHIHVRFRCGRRERRCR